jgi:hypothetical protein
MDAWVTALIVIDNLRWALWGGFLELINQLLIPVRLAEDDISVHADEEPQNEGNPLLYSWKKIVEKTQVDP